MANKVTNMKDIGKLGVKVKDGMGERLDIDKAAEGVSIVIDAALPEEADGEEGDLKDLRSFKARDFLKGHKDDTEWFLRDVAKVEEIFEGLDEMTSALQKLESLNEKKKLRVDTPHMKELRARIVAAKGLLEKINPEAVQLVRFRRDHEELRALVSKGHDVFKALKKGEKPDEATLKQLTAGYADLLHSLLREERIVEVEEDQLHEWADRHESFSDHAASWFYRDCRVCDRGRCRTHWYWGVNGDDQSIQLAKDLRALNNINSRICDHLNPRPPRPGKAKPAPTTEASVAPAVNEPSEGSTPVEPESGPTES